MNSPVRVDEQVRRQFELSWQRGEPPTIADFLPAEEKLDYAVTLEELVHIDIEYRGSRQQRNPTSDHLLLPLADYFEQFPQLSETEIIRRLIAQEIHVRHACGLNVNHEDYVRDFGEVVAQGEDVDALLVDTKAAFRSTVFKPPTAMEAPTLIPASTDPMKTAMTVLPGIDRTTTMTSVPEEIGNYRLIRQLGAGGMGCVYEAEELDSGQRVALKVVLPELGTSDEAIERFRQEGQLASTISHPNSVFVLEADQQGEYPYIVMELVKGTDLDQHVRENGPLEILDALRKTIDLIEGLEEAHRLGVIHRDVKPSNCFLTEQGRVKIGDFGLSRTLAEDAQLTLTGSFIGTPLYASPEQIRNDELDNRTDVYSVASTLYFLLTGQAPFHTDNAVSAMARIVADPAPEIRNHRPELHRAIARVIHRGLETDRSKRWRSMADFRNALRQFLPEQRAPARESLRFLAFLIDYLTVSLLLDVPLRLLVLLAERMGLSKGVGDAFRRWSDGELLTPILLPFIYFVAFESLYGWTFGKRLFGFRVRRRDGQPAGFPSIFLRTAVLWSCLFGIILYASFLTVPENIGWMSLLVFAGLVMALVPALTMRESNSYRGLHDLCSGTMVVKIPSRRTRRRGIAKVANVSASLPTITDHDLVFPRELGAYRINGPLQVNDSEIVLDAEDDRLKRNIWIHLRNPNAAASTNSRRNIDRAERLRWLASGEHEQRPWDAYLAAEGMPLTQYLKVQGKIDWLATREMLESLATELENAIREKSLPKHLSPQQLWIRPDGALLLMDFTLDPEQTVMAKETETLDQQAVALLLATAISCLEGSCPTRENLSTRNCVESVVDSQMSYRGRLLLARCVDPSKPLESVEQFRRELDATKDQRLDARRVGSIRRLKHLVRQWFMLSAPMAALIINFSIAQDERGELGATAENRMHIPGYLFLILIVPCIVMIWTFIARGGYAYYSAGIMISKTNGARASRLRCTWRALLAWLPFLAIMIGFRLLNLHYSEKFEDSVFPVLLGILALYPILALIFPRRGLHDLIAGTALIPR